MVNEPVQPFQWRLTIDRFEYIKCACDGFIVGSMQAKRPAVLREESDNFREIAFHRCGQFWSRFKKILEIRCRENEHLASSVYAIEVITLPGFHKLGPALEIFQFLL